VTLLSVPFLFADRILARVRSASAAGVGRDGTLGRALGFVGTSATILVVLFAAVTGQPDSTLLHEGNWCGQGLPWWAASAAVAVMAFFLGSIAALASALPRAATSR